MKTGYPMAPIKFGVGQSVLRKEDDALIRGKGRYTDDHSPHPALHALMLRSPHPHHNSTMMAAKARGLRGVSFFLPGPGAGYPGVLPCFSNPNPAPSPAPPYPIL